MPARLCAATYLRAGPGTTRGEPTIARERHDDPGPTRRVQSSSSTSALWWPPSKIAGRYLAPYLATARPVPLSSAPLTDRAAPRHHQADAADHEDALELALLLAENDARWGDYAIALRGLDAAEALNGALPAEYEARRRQWQRALADASRQPGL